MPHQLKSSGLAAASRLGIFAGVRMIRRHHTLVLAYHGVLTAGRRRSAYLDYNFIDTDRFDRQLGRLRRYYTPVPMSAFVAAREGGRRLPPRSVLVTFDDGFANNWRVAFPILRKHRIPFTVFLTTGMIGRPAAQLWTERISRAVYLTERGVVDLQLGSRRCTFLVNTPALRESASRAILGQLKRLSPDERQRQVGEIERSFGRPALVDSDRERYDFLTWDEVRDMSASGVEFGSHTQTHPILSTLDDAALRRELVESKRDIERELGIACDTFAYPNGGPGDFGPREEDAVREAGYRCAFALLGGLVAAGSNRYAVERVNIGRDFDDPLFDAAATGLLGAARKLRSAVGRSSAPPPEDRTSELEYVR